MSILSSLVPRTTKPGTRPGALVDADAPARFGQLTVYRVDYGGQAPVEQRRGQAIDTALAPAADAGHTLTWLHFEGDVGAADLRTLGARFRLHQLALEDVLNHGQRPKLDTYHSHVFVTLALPVARGDELGLQQVSVFFGADFVLSFHAGIHDVFAPLRERIHVGRGRITRGESDYLAYCLADIVVDSYFAVFADYDDRVETLEDEIFEDQTHDMVAVIHVLRRKLIALRKVLRGHDELMLRWTALEHELIHEVNRPYFRDVADHARRALELADGYYDTTRSLLDTHLSLASSRLNDVMRLLTLIATVFMPLSFIAGLYGMNFTTDSPWNMPELGWRYGYPAVLLVMGMLCVGMLIYFKRKRWL